MVESRVTIVTPAYNAGLFVHSAVESVLRQTYPDWELLVVDDCSKDNTREIVQSFADGDPRIHLIRQKANGGPARARQAALDAATGRYVAFLDSDDYWLPYKLEHQIRFMREKNAAVSYTQYRRVSANGTVVGRLIKIPPRLTYRQLLGNTAMFTSTVVIDKLLTGPFRMTETFYDDFALWLEILRRGFVAHGLEEDHMRYRVVRNSWSRNKLRSAMWVWRTYRNVEKLDIPLAAWSFARYAWRAVCKYRTF